MEALPSFLALMRFRARRCYHPAHEKAVPLLLLSFLYAAHLPGNPAPLRTWFGSSSAPCGPEPTVRFASGEPRPFPSVHVASNRMIIAVCLTGGGDRGRQVGQTLEGPFSAVSTPQMAPAAPVACTGPALSWEKLDMGWTLVCVAAGLRLRCSSNFDRHRRVHSRLYRSRSS